MKKRTGLLCAGSALTALALVGCDLNSVDAGADDGLSLREALARSPEELELADLPGRRAVAERMLLTARTQAELGEHEPLTEPSAVDVVGTADGLRDARGADPILFASVRDGTTELVVTAAGQAELFTASALAADAVDPRIRVDVGFPRESSEALAGRSEAQSVEALSSFLAALGQHAAGDVASWTVMRRPGLRAAAVLLVDDSIIELNPAFVYYAAALTRPVAVVAAAPASAGGPDSAPPANDWQVFLRWLQSADPAQWTNLGTGESQSYDAGYTEPTPTPTLPCCCGCSALGLGAGSSLGGLAVVLGALLPLGALLLIRRRG
jgi:hypothetical protein